MNEYIHFINHSSMQFFYNTQYKDRGNNIDGSKLDNKYQNKDIDDIETFKDYQDEVVDDIEFFEDYQDEVADDIETFEDYQNEVADDIETFEDYQDEVADDIETFEDYQDEVVDDIETFEDYQDEEVDMECFDDRDEDTLIDPSPYPKVTSRTLDIGSNTPEIPTGNKDGVIAKIPVVLAQLILPFNTTSTIDLPDSALEIKDIKKTLKLTESILLQPTNVLSIKGFVRKSIEYSSMGSTSKGISGKSKHYTIVVPFECSTAVSFFTEPLDPVINTREVFQYNDTDLIQGNLNGNDESVSKESSRFHQISEEFFNETPFCKLISSKIVEFDECISPRNSENDSIQIQDNMVIELRIEVLQNQPIVIAPIKDNLNK